jgi:hypothetical protein
MIVARALAADTKFHGLDRRNRPMSVAQLQRLLEHRTLRLPSCQHAQ